MPAAAASSDPSRKRRRENQGKGDDGAVNGGGMMKGRLRRCGEFGCALSNAETAFNLLPVRGQAVRDPEILTGEKAAGRAAFTISF
jgi:hypothetical protein